jgi:activator of HSP90 ATPase
MGIHQQAMIDAYPREVYEVLADAAALSALSGMSGTAGRAAGEEFTAFDGHVTGRQVELAPGTRIVQAWRFPVWEPGIYTLVRFTLAAEPAGPASASRTLLRIDQQGEPAGADTLGCHLTWHDHLSEGWLMFYLSPLARHFEAQAASARAAAVAEIESLAAAARRSPAPAR